jgi:hypothetical protein
MGESPEAKAQRAAREAADRALAVQEDLIKKINEKAYGYESKAKELIPVLSGFSGTLPADYVKGTRSKFDEYTGAITNMYKPALEKFTPGLLTSPSATELNKSLMQSAGAYTRGVRDVSDESAAKLYSTLAAGPQSSATNLALDPEIMRLATNPPIKTELNRGRLGYSQYTDYNV